MNADLGYLLFSVIPLGLIFASLRSKATLRDLIWKDTNSQGRKEPQT